LTATQVFSLIVEMAISRTWQIAPDGSDITGDGSDTKPFATIQHGIDLASHGDTVLVYQEYTEGISNSTARTSLSARCSS